MSLSLSSLLLLLLMLSLSLLLLLSLSLLLLSLMLLLLLLSSSLLFLLLLLLLSESCFNPLHFLFARKIIKKTFALTECGKLRFDDMKCERLREKDCKRLLERYIATELCEWEQRRMYFRKYLQYITPPPFLVHLLKKFFIIQMITPFIFIDK